MIGDAQLSYRLSRSTLLILLISGILLICFPVRSQERATPAVATRDLSDSVVAADLVDVSSDSVPEADEGKPSAEGKLDHLFLIGIFSQRSPSDAESISTACASFRGGGGKMVLRKGMTFKVGDTSATVEDIEDREVILRVNEKIRKWKLGMSFAALLDDEAGPPGLAADPTAEPAAKRPANVDAVRSAVQIELLDDPEVIVLRGKQEDVKRVADLIRQIEQGQPKSAPAVNDDPKGPQEGPQVEVRALGELDPQSLNLVLRTLLAGRPEVRLDVDPKTRQLIVLAPPADHATVRARPVPWVIYLRYAQAGQVAEVVQEVYHDRQKDLSVQIVPRLNALIVVAPDALFRQIKELIEALDRAVTEAHETVLTVPRMRGENLQRLREAIERGMKASEFEHRQRFGKPRGQEASRQYKTRSAYPGDR